MIVFYVYSTISTQQGYMYDSIKHAFVRLYVKCTYVVKEFLHGALFNSNSLK